jgi:hypothetical protein
MTTQQKLPPKLLKLKIWIAQFEQAHGKGPFMKDILEHTSATSSQVWSMERNGQIKKDKAKRYTVVNQEGNSNAYMD